MKSKTKLFSFFLFIIIITGLFSPFLVQGVVTGLWNESRTPSLEGDTDFKYDCDYYVDYLLTPDIPLRTVDWIRLYYEAGDPTPDYYQALVEHDSNTYKLLDFRPSEMTGVDKGETVYFYLKIRDSEGTYGVTDTYSFLVNIDTTAPTISDISDNSDNPEPEDAITVQATIVDDDEVASAKTYIKINSGSWTGYIMSEGGSNVWSKTFSGGTFDAGDTVEYYIWANDISGNVIISDDYATTGLSDTWDWTEDRENFFPTTDPRSTVSWVDNNYLFQDVTTAYDWWWIGIKGTGNGGSMSIDADTYYQLIVRCKTASFGDEHELHYIDDGPDGSWLALRSGDLDAFNYRYGDGSFADIHIDLRDISWITGDWTGTLTQGFRIRTEREDETNPETTENEYYDYMFIIGLHSFYVNDWSAPNIGTPTHVPPDDIENDDSVTVSSTITDNVDVTGAAISSHDGTSWSWDSMSEGGSNVWSGEISPKSYDTIVYYTVYARDTALNFGFGGTTDGIEHQLNLDLNSFYLQNGQSLSHDDVNGWANIQYEAGASHKFVGIRRDIYNMDTNDYCMFFIRWRTNTAYEQKFTGIYSFDYSRYASHYSSGSSYYQNYANKDVNDGWVITYGLFNLGIRGVETDLRLTWTPQSYPNQETTTDDYIDVDWVAFVYPKEYTIVDITNPSISSPDHSPANPDENDDIILSCSASDSSSGVDYVNIYYRTNSGSWSVYQDQSSPYSYNIGTRSVGDVISYFFYCEDNAGNEVSTYEYMTTQQADAMDFLEGDTENFAYSHSVTNFEVIAGILTIDATTNYGFKPTGAPWGSESSPTWEYNFDFSTYSVFMLVAKSTVDDNFGFTLDYYYGAYENSIMGFNLVSGWTTFFYDISGFSEDEDGVMLWCYGSSSSIRVEIDYMGIINPYSISVTDQTNPVLSNPNHSPNTPKETQNIDFTIDVTDNHDVDTVLVYIKINSGSWTEYEMSYVSGDQYKYTLSSGATSIGDAISYFFFANDTTGNEVVISDYATTELSDAWDFNEGDTETLVWQTNNPADVTVVDGKLRCEATASVTTDFYVKFNPVLYPVGTNYDLLIMKVKSNIDASVRLFSYTGTPSWKNYATISTYDDEVFRVETSGLSYKSSMNTQGIRFRFRINSGNLAVDDYFEIDYIYLVNAYSFTVTDQTNPVISDVDHTPENPDDSDDIIIDATITDNGVIDDVRLYYQVNAGGYTYVDMNYVSGDDWTYNLGTFNEYDDIDYYIWVNDTYGNYYQSSTYNIIVLDSTPPVITNVYHLADPHEYDETTLETGANIVDDHLDTSRLTTFIRKNGGSWYERELELDEGSKYNDIIPSDWTSIMPLGYGDFIEYYIKAYDTLDNFATSSTYNFYVVDLTSPEVDELTSRARPARFDGEGFITEAEPVDNCSINIVGYDEIGIDKGKGYFKINNGEYQYVDVTMYVAAGGWKVGIGYIGYFDVLDNITWYAWVNDTSGNTDTSTPKTFMIYDYDNPTINSFSIVPLEARIGSDSITFTVNISDNLDLEYVVSTLYYRTEDSTIWLSVSMSLENNLFVYTFVGNSFSVTGTYDCFVRVNDIANTVDSETLQFIIAEPGPIPPPTTPPPKPPQNDTTFHVVTVIKYSAVGGGLLILAGIGFMIARIQKKEEKNKRRG